MKRIAYYVINCSSEENQDGIFHYSKPFVDIVLAQEAARRLTSKRPDDFVRLEAHKEFYEHNDWHIDHEQSKAVTDIEYE
jgi:hypothetical protein